ncbi:MAG: hypothetical protein WDN24_19900 [Sphingomonas sp.]
MGEIVVIRSNDDGRTWDRNSIVHIMDMAIKEEKDLPAARQRTGPACPRSTSHGRRHPAALLARCERVDARLDRRRADLAAAHPAAQMELPAISMPGTSMYSTREDGVMLFGIQTNAPGMENHRPDRLRSPDGVRFHYLGEIVGERPKSLFSEGGTPFRAAMHYHPPADRAQERQGDLGAALPARRALRDLDRSVRKPRRRAHLALAEPRQRLGLVGRPGADGPTGGSCAPTAIATRPVRGSATA